MTYLAKLMLSVDVYIVATAMFLLSVHNKINFPKTEDVVNLSASHTIYSQHAARGVFIVIDANMYLTIFEFKTIPFPNKNKTPGCKSPKVAEHNLLSFTI